jgi:poly(3-hydroxybutyrate) depolymerase
MYVGYDAMRRFAAPFGAWAGAVQAAWADVPFGAPVSAAAEMFERSMRTYPKPTFGLDSTEVDGSPVHVREVVVQETPFCRLVRFERQTARRDPKMLVVAPLSGHHATLVRDTIRALLPDHDVYVTDWVDAREVPLAHGGFGLHDFIDLLPGMIHAVSGGDPVHVMAVCQPCVPVLAAVARMAEEGDPAQPATMTLISGPIDPRISPTRVGAFAQEHPLAWIEATLVHSVPWGAPGHGRRVYPGFLQLQAFMALDMGGHVEAHLRHVDNVARGAACDGEAAEKHRRFYDEYFAVMDLPAEFYLETVREVFQEYALARGTMRHRGILVRPDAIVKTSLLTIEGSKDEITGLGQTRAAHALCRGIPDDRKAHHLQAGVGHYGTFSGRAWRDEIAPVVQAFVRTHA